MVLMDMIYFVFVFTVLLVVVHTKPAEFFCYFCDDGSDNNDCQTMTTCHTTEEVVIGNVSHHLQSKCMARVYFHENGLILQKICANSQTCAVHEGRNIEGCGHPDEEFEGLCTYCCDTTGCNKGLPPYGVVHTS